MPSGYLFCVAATTPSTSWVTTSVIGLLAPQGKEPKGVERDRRLVLVATVSTPAPTFAAVAQAQSSGLPLSAEPSTPTMTRKKSRPAS